MQVTANGMSIYVERRGDPAAPALLMIRGLGSQIIHWPEAMLAALEAEGLQLILFDNRDAGLSQLVPEGGYDLSDMAADAAGVLDACGIDAAHVLGISMGGGILQRMMLEHGPLVLSATIVFSSSWAEGLPGRTPEVEALLIGDPGDPAEDREAVIAHVLKCDYAWGSPAYPFDEAERRALIGEAIDRAWRPEGVARQYQAIMASGGAAARLAEIETPTLVVHGDADALLPPEHGRDLAARIPGARYVEVPGMGHDLDAGAHVPVVEAFRAFRTSLPG